MERITLHDKCFVPFITSTAIHERVALMAAAINHDYKGRKPLLLAILNGSFIFAADLFRQLTIDAEISFIKLSSYSGTTSAGQVATAIGLAEDVQGRDIIIVEDIIDTGKTLHSFLPQLMQQGVASVAIAAFLTKPAALVYDVQASYFGFAIENRFVVGYGLDYNGLGRNVPSLFVLDEE